MPAKTHGMCMSPEYSAWNNAKRRCIKESHPDYPKYGGRGISMCDRWLNSFENFYADMGDRPSSKHSIDRIDNDGDYEPNNCRWATRTEQQRNLGMMKSNTSGVTGVHFCKKREKYLAHITVKNKFINLGYHPTLDDAAKARETGQLKHW